MKDYKELISEIIVEQVPELTIEEAVGIVEVPTDEKMGDYAFPCFRLAKLLRKAPPIIAEEISEKIKENSLFTKVETVNGYINMFLDKSSLITMVVKEANEKGSEFGNTNVGEGKKVIVEYSSPNIAKPFHIGHIRSTVIGNSIYKIYAALGYDAIRINHLGDYGTQFGKMIVAYRKWGNKEDVVNEPIKTLLKYYTKFHEECEANPELEDEAREVFVKLEKGEAEEVALWQWFRDESLKEFSRVYEMLGIEFDSYAGESFYSDKMGTILDELEEKNLLVESKGAQIVDLEQFNMAPALVTKKDGSTLYITRDIAAAFYRKKTYDFYKNIYVVASQQNLHFQQLIKIVELLGYEWSQDCIHIPFGLVSLEEGTMSTRQGRVVFLEDVLNNAVEKTKEVIIEKNVVTDNIEETAKAVGIGAVIFNELSSNRIKDYVFSWEKVLNFEGETGPYVQYTYARAASVIRKAEEEDLKAATSGNFDAKYITGDKAYELAKAIYDLPEVIKEAGEKYEPSIITRHIVDIAQDFNRFYHDEHILVESKEERVAKIALTLAAKTAIKNGLALLGIQAPEKM